MINGFFDMINRLSGNAFTGGFGTLLLITCVTGGIGFFFMLFRFIKSLNILS